MNKGCRPDPRSMPNSKEYDEGHERTFGSPRGDSKGGRWKWSKELSKLIEVGGPEDVGEEDLARNAPIMCDRFMEGKKAPDGTDISNRTRYREYKKRAGVTDASDYGDDYGDRVRAARERKADKALTESLERSFYKHMRY